MDFLQAVTELAGRRCRRITRDGVMAWGLAGKSGMLDEEVSISSFLATDWQLVDPVPQYEDVEETVRVGLYPDGGYSVSPGIWNGDYPIVEGKLTYRRPIKPKVKRREEITMSDSAEWRPIRDDSKIPEVTSKGHFFYEWEE